MIRTFLLLCLCVPPVWSQTVTYINQGKPVQIELVAGQWVIGLKGGETAAKTWIKGIVDGQGKQALPSGIQTVKALGNGIVVVTTTLDTAAKVQNELALLKEVEFVYPVYRRPGTKLKIYPKPELVVRLASQADAEQVAARYGLSVLRKLLFTDDQYILGLKPARDPFAVSDALWKDPEVIWSNPNCIVERQKRFRPNDPLYSRQWHLHNDGSGGGVSGADISAEAAWDLLRGRSDVVIAVVDDAVDIAHPDLLIWSNPAEANGTAGIDDDGNGLVDDIHGWDFGSGDNDPSPDIRSDDNPDGLESESHGTSVAGVAAARGNNALGVAGAAFGCSILPVKISANGEFASDEESIANAIRYASKYGDVMNNSWGAPEISDAEYEALNDATSDRGKRGAKRVPVLFASGNDATYFLDFLSDEALTPGRQTIQMVYAKDAAVTSGEDKVWIESFGLISLDSETGEQTDDGILVYATETGFPQGVSGGGNKPFQSSPSDLSETGFVFVSGAISHNQESKLIWSIDVPDDGQNWYFAMKFRTSTQASTNPDAEFPNGDLFDVYLGEDYLYGSVNWGEEGLVPPFSGITPLNLVPMVGHNLHPNIINIGASTDRDVRSLYSQWGPEMDFVAPSSGGLQGIITTDITGPGNGYDPDSDYTEAEGTEFSGTSSACPLAAGVFAMVIAANPNLTQEEIIAIFQQTSDKIGPVSYNANGFNEQYGYGRLNMAAAVQRALETVVEVENWQLY